MPPGRTVLHLWFAGLVHRGDDLRDFVVERPQFVQIDVGSTLAEHIDAVDPEREQSGTERTGGASDERRGK